MRKWLKIVFWIAFISSTLVLLVMARNHQQAQVMTAPEIQLEIQDGISLINQKELLQQLELNNLFYEGITKQELDLEAIEDFLLNLNELESVEVYSYLGSDWVIKALVRRPVARILLENGSSFFVDSRGKAMHLSPYTKPRILTFTGVEPLLPQGFKLSELINNDSLITKSGLSQIYRISTYVCKSAFYNAQIVQVHYSKEDGFVLIPRVGKQKVIFGSADSEEQVNRKFEKLTTFYEEVIPFEGWDKYKSINLKFENQIVAKKN